MAILHVRRGIAALIWKFLQAAPAHTDATGSGTARAAQASCGQSTRRAVAGARDTHQAPQSHETHGAAPPRKGIVQLYIQQPEEALGHHKSAHPALHAPSTGREWQTGHRECTKPVRSKVRVASPLAAGQAATNSTPQECISSAARARGLLSRGKQRMCPPCQMSMSRQTWAHAARSSGHSSWAPESRVPSSPKRPWCHPTSSFSACVGSHDDCHSGSSI
jgi:hypothetical protein